MANPTEADRETLRLLYDLHQTAQRGQLRQKPAGELVESATALDAAFRAASDTGYRASLARVLLTLYVHLDRRLRSAPADEDGLPQVPGIAWCFASPLAGLLEDIRPFAAVDEWAAAIGTAPRGRRARRRTPRPQARTGDRPGPLGYEVEIEEAQVLTFPLGVNQMPPLQDSDQRNSALMRAMADQARGERERSWRGEIPPGDESPFAAEMIREANEAIAMSFFDSPVARRLIRNYSLGRGDPLTLTRSEMRQLRAYFNLSSARLSEEFQRVLRQVRDEGLAVLVRDNLDQTQLVRNVHFEVTGTTNISGTLAAFAGRCMGMLTVTVFFTADPTWVFEGRMDWYDEWDFESHAHLFDEDLRSEAGTTRTTLGHHFVIVRPFRVGSEQIGIRQASGEAQATLTYQ